MCNRENRSESDSFMYHLSDSAHCVGTTRFSVLNRLCVDFSCCVDKQILFFYSKIFCSFIINHFSLLMILFPLFLAVGKKQQNQRNYIRRFKCLLRKSMMKRFPSGIFADDDYYSHDDYYSPN